MNKVFILALILFSFGLIGKTTKEKEKKEVELFGDYGWEDSLVTFINKTNKLKGIKKKQLCVYTESGARSNCFNIDGVINKTQITKHLGSTLKKMYKSWYELLLKDLHYNKKTKRKKCAVPSNDSSMTTIWCYKNKQGEEIPVCSESITISAYPIMIKEVPFTLTISLSPSIGLSLYKPINVLHDSFGCSYPFILEKMELFSSSILLTPEKLQEIGNSLHLKYPDLSPNPAACDDYHDDKYNKISFSSHAIEYRHTFKFGQKLKKLYDEHLIKLEAKKFKKKTDHSTKL